MAEIVKVSQPHFIPRSHSTLLDSISLKFLYPGSHTRRFIVYLSWLPQIKTV